MVVRKTRLFISKKDGIHIALKKLSFVRKIVRSKRKLFQKYQNIRIFTSNIGFLPLKVNKIKQAFRFFKDKQSFKRQRGKITQLLPILDEFITEAGVVRGHNFDIDLLVAKMIHSQNPVSHVDIGSRIDGFVAHVASFREIHVYDVRTLPKSNPSNIFFQKVDIINNIPNRKVDSISWLHALEHFGLGRYGDPIRPNGHIAGLINMAHMLQKGGRIYIAVPIGEKDQTFLNAHRNFHPKSILSWAPKNLLLKESHYIDDNGILYTKADINIESYLN
jgi:hypothetical protein